MLGLRSVGNRRLIVPEGWNNASGLCCMCVYSFRREKKNRKGGLIVGIGPFVQIGLSLGKRPGIALTVLI